MSDYLARMKLAVAMAFIKSKPKGMTGREYAERLSKEFQTSQLNWKARYERLMDKVMAQQSEIQQLQQFSDTTGRTSSCLKRNYLELQ